MKKDASQIAALEQVATRSQQMRVEMEKAMRIAHSAGWSLRAIARAAGVSHGQVRRTISQDQASGS